jgi:poly(3-hydroxybutyrate) depolymerase
MTGTGTTFATLAGTLLLTLAAAVVAPAASAASLVEVSGFGDNPGGMRMHVHVPDTHPANPGIVVAMHGCGGSGPGSR